jgi:Na+/H+-translocating membrane pyrophosphatase
MDSKLKIHLCWIIAVLTIIIIILISVDWNGVKDLAGILNFALGLTSLVLAVVAIVYGFVANNAFAGTVSKIESAASDINEVVRAIPAKLSAIEKTTQDMRPLFELAAALPRLLLHAGEESQVQPGFEVAGGGAGEYARGLDAGAVAALADLTWMCNGAGRAADSPRFIASPAAMPLGEQDGLPADRRR